MDMSQKLHKEFMGLQWWKFSGIIFIANCLYPHWSIKTMFVIAFGYGLIYMLGSFQKNKPLYVCVEDEDKDEDKDENNNKDNDNV